MTFSLACPDWQAKVAAGQPPLPDLPFFTERGARAVRALNMLRLADVPGTPTFGEAGADWFRAIVAITFGSLDPVTKQRLIRELFLLVPKKNSKTTNGALAMLVALLMNERPRANFYMTAPVQDVADIAFSAVAGAIDLDPVLDKKFHVRHHLKQIIHRESHASLEIMTFDPSVATGLKVSGGALLDEIHVIARMAKAAQALRQLRGGMLPFPESFLWMITTQSDGVPTGVFKDELAKARDIRDGKRAGAMLPVLYEFSREQQTEKDGKFWRNPANWPLVTPNLGKSITLDRLVEEFTTARDTSDEELRAWASQHLNIEIGLAMSADGWAGARFWEDAADETIDSLDALLERSEVCTIGIDGGGLDDLLGLSVLGREKETRRWLHWCHGWAHRIVFDRRTDIAEQLRGYEKDGDLTIVEKPGDDVVEVADICCRIRDAGLLPEKHAIGVDAAGIGDIVDELTTEERGFTVGADGHIVAIQQGWRLNGAIKTAERKVAGGELVHGGRPIMAWNVGNAKAEPRGNAIVITKQAAGSAKIDLLCALFDSVSLMNLNPEASAGSISQGFVAL